MKINSSNHYSEQSFISWQLKWINSGVPNRLNKSFSIQT